KEARYAALSYVWGFKPELWLVKDTEGYLQTADSIVPANERIPRTIRDALTFCRKINIPYIWVDSFCIIQDCKKDQAIEIPRMFEIYSQATVTLVAISASSSRDPLPGVTPNTRLWHQYHGTVKGLELITCYPSLVTEIEQSTWFTRGWTLQEAAFSKSLIFFTQNQAIFLCRQSMFCEDTVWEGSNVEAKSPLANRPTPASGIPMSLMLLGIQARYFDRGFFSILEQFTERRLAEDSDALKAVDAIIQMISKDKEHGSQCLFGMPEKHFGAALGWTFRKGHMLGPLSRRKMFPSWSWAGWKGPILWDLFHTMYDHNMDRVRDWEPSGIIETTNLDKELYEKTGKIISPVRQHPHPEQPKLSLLIDTGVLQFWTSSALLLVSRTEDENANGLPTFGIMKPNVNRWCFERLQCDPYWRSKQPDQLEFIVIAASRLKPPNPPMYKGGSWGCGTSRHKAEQEGRLIGNFHLFQRERKHWETHMQDRVVLDVMCIEWVDGIAERVQVCHSWQLDDWLEMEPKEKLIKLG
ncbi:related to tol protein, partial [Phialocephala subalpina]